MIYIVIPVFNRLNFTASCVRSLLTQSNKNYKIIVVDDGSTDNTVEYLQHNFPGVLIIKGTGDLWWTGATNLGVQKAIQLSASESDFLLTLNNDLEVRENYLENLLSAALQNPGALIGSVSVDITSPGTVHFAGTMWNAKTAKYKPAIPKNISYQQLVSMADVIKTDLLPGRGVLVPINLFKKIGLYDFSHFPHYMADEDFALRAKAANCKLLVATNAVVFNHVNETGLKSKKISIDYFKQSFTSMRSPVNYRNRWNWAKRHAGIFPPVYFVFDMMRIFKGLLSKS